MIAGRHAQRPTGARPPPSGHPRKMAGLVGSLSNPTEALRVTMRADLSVNE